ncbi:uncharacterized protein [Diadema antillarum]|uniref:uncharacterized protein n=1 Tax=Diadema antillarum TaxID=105358 RepID=UPI003A865558
MKVASRAISRHVLTLFLFCLSVWLLTHSFLALHNGCWISDPKILTEMKEKTLECQLPQTLEVIKSVSPDERELRRKRLDVAMSTGEPHGPNVADRAEEPFRFSPDRGKIPSRPEEIVKDSTSQQELGSQKLFPKTRAIDSMGQVQGPERESPKAPAEISGRAVVRAAEFSPNLTEWREDREPREAPPLPAGRGVPALGRYPFVNMSKNIVKIERDTWQTMGCFNRITIFSPGPKALLVDPRWMELTNSFVKVGVGYYLLKCPDEVCDLMVRVGGSPKGIVRGTTLLVGAASRLSQNRTKRFMRAIEKLGPDMVTNIYLFSLDNSPMINHFDPYMANFQYHYTMTYHSRSDVPIPHGRFLRDVGAEKPRNWAEGKTKMVAWVEDNCDETFWPRWEYVLELSRHIPVDMYGKCGNRTCASTHCMEELKQYRFYLALEEVACDEYITLSFWERGLASGAVPVVYGGRKHTYSKLAPPGSFIHISDFSSPLELARNLRQLSASDVEYNKFHEWRTTGSIDISGPGFRVDSLCGMTKQLIHVNPPDKKTMSKERFYNSCRKGMYWKGFARSGDLQNWTPWL